MTDENEEFQAKRRAALAKLDAITGGAHKIPHPAWSAPPTYVVVPSLPPSVKFLVIRDPLSDTPRMCVFNEQTVTDDLMYEAVGRLAVDERREPTTTLVRTLTMFDDNRYEVETGGVVSKFTMRPMFPDKVEPKLGRNSDSMKLLRETAKAEWRDIAPGLRGRKYTPKG